jgi:hypothetical protein
VLAVVVDETVLGPQPPHDLDRLLQHLQPYVERRPDRPEDVLVQRLARTDTEPEPPVQQDGAGRGRLRDDRRVDPHGRAGDSGGHRQLAHLGDRTDGRPDERTLALFVVPRMEVVADPQPVEPGLLGQARLLDQFGGCVLLAGQEVSDFHVVPPLLPTAWHSKIAVISLTVR